MENITPQLYTLLVFMVVGSIIAIETRNLLSAVISVSAVGFCWLETRAFAFSNRMR